METNLDFGYTDIQNTYTGSASDVMCFPTDYIKCIKEFIYGTK